MKIFNAFNIKKIREKSGKSFFFVLTLEQNFSVIKLKGIQNYEMYEKRATYINEKNIALFISYFYKKYLFNH